jgi:hypothetical protein
LTRSDGTTSYDQTNFYQILDNPAFNATKKTVIYSYGFTQTIGQSDVQKVINAYLVNNEYNFVVATYPLLSYTVIVSFNFYTFYGFSFQYFTERRNKWEKYCWRFSRSF